MDDLDSLRRKRLAELQAQQARATAQNPAAQDPQAAAAERAAAEEAALERLLQQVLEPEARERLTRVRMSRPDLASKVAAQLVQAVQGGRLARRMTDAELRQVLQHLTGQDRDITITRK